MFSRALAIKIEITLKTCALCYTWIQNGYWLDGYKLLVKFDILKNLFFLLADKAYSQHIPAYLFDTHNCIYTKIVDST